MKWQKIKHIEIPPLQHLTGLQTHLANTEPKLIHEDVLRVYCNVRDPQNRSYVTFLDLNPQQNFSIRYFHETVLFPLGPPGAFDDNGASLACILNTDRHDYLFYLGWNLSVSVPFHNAIGLAISPTGKDQFEKVSIGPILDRDLTDPYSLSYPFVMAHNGLYKMWYGSHKQWGKGVNDMIHCIKYAESKDLIHWQRDDIICLDPTLKDYAFSRPYVIFEHNTFKMWYSYRGASYRIGYAESRNGIDWERLDHEVGIDVAATGWDSQMIEYPSLFRYGDKQYMLYNGNAYGKTGFGIAVLEA